MTEPTFANPELAERLVETLVGREGGEAAVSLVRAAADPDMALRNLVSYVEASGALPGDPEAAITLFAGSQSMSVAAIRDPAVLEAVLADPDLPDGDVLAERVKEAVDGAGDDPRAALRTFVRTETLRLLLADLTGRAPLEAVAAQLSRIADAAVDAALGAALLEYRDRYGTPRDDDGAEATITVIGLGKLGGGELNYSSDIDLVFLYSAEGRTDAEDRSRARRNREFFTRVVERTRNLLADQTPLGHCYRVDLRLRPEGSTGALTRTVRSALDYYDKLGRTWERQALIKARPIAGDLELGRQGFVSAVEGFVYGRPLIIEDIGRIKDLKHRIERRDPDERQVKAGPGGIRDVEFTVQFLQLLNGHRLPSVRSPATLPALRRLREAGALTEEEETALRESYVFLRTVEHRLQTVHEVRTHLLPADEAGIRHLALRMGLGRGGEDPVEEFRRLHSRHTAAAREILSRLFHDLFVEQSAELGALTDFVLHAERHEEPARRWLTDHGFAEPDQALGILASLGKSPNPRARKFLASLAPRLLLRISETPDPDRALRNLQRVIDAQGAPATFYQLLSRYPDILGVFADLCGWSQHLAERLAANPELIDAFADSLVAPRPLPSLEAAEDPVEALHDVKDLALLRVGVRDIQGKANTENTARDLTDLAEHVIRLALGLVDPPKGESMAVLALGKLGACEMDYASDLDLLFVRGAGGDAEAANRAAQAVLKLLNQAGPRGRLYEADPRVRPWGRSGQLVAGLEAFDAYYRERAGVAELMMLTKARAVAGDPDLGAAVEARIEDILYGAPPRPDVIGELVDMRSKLEAATSGRDVKRGFGGIVDVEFLTEGLKLLHGHSLPALRTTGTLDALEVARRENLITGREHETLLTAIQFLKSVQSRMRIVYDMALARIPETAVERSRLARRLGYVDTDAASAGMAMLSEYEYHTQRTREVFLTVIARQVAAD